MAPDAQQPRTNPVDIITSHVFVVVSPHGDPHLHRHPQLQTAFAHTHDDGGAGINILISVRDTFAYARVMEIGL